MQWWCAARATPWEWSWSPYPGVWIFLLALAGGYVAVLRGRDERPSVRRRSAFAGGLLALWLALDWPLGALGAGYLASAHMMQFLLVAFVAPPLLLLGLPPEHFGSFRPARTAEAPLRMLSHPLATMTVFVATMAWTHWPPVVDAWMTSQLGSFALDLVWLGSGLLFWWPVVVARPRRSWFGYPARMGYLVVATIVNTALFAYLTYAKLPLYELYELAPPGPWLTTRQDQVVAGLLMKFGGGAVLWSAVTVLFALWYLESTREDRRPDRRAAGAGPGPRSLPEGGGG